MSQVIAMLTSGHLSQRVKWAENQPISRLMHLALARPELISLAAGFVDQQTLPTEPVSQAVAAVLSDPRVESERAFTIWNHARPAGTARGVARAACDGRRDERLRNGNDRRQRRVNRRQQSACCT